MTRSPGDLKEMNLKDYWLKRATCLMACKNEAVASISKAIDMVPPVFSVTNQGVPISYGR
jgi:hypothetical protein